VSKKLYAGFLLVALLAAITGGVGYLQITSVKVELHEVIDDLLPVKDESMEMTIVASESVEAASEYVSYGYGDPALRLEFEGTIEAYDEI